MWMTGLEERVVESVAVALNSNSPEETIIEVSGVPGKWE